MKVALVTAGFSFATNYDMAAFAVYENLGLEYLAAALERRGFEVDLLSAPLLGWTQRRSCSA